jgi:hypothetical protein
MAEEKLKGNPTLKAGDLHEIEYLSTTWVALIENGVPPEALLAREFWAHHAANLKPWDEIKARAKDGTWMASYVVLDCSRTWAKVYPLTLTRLTTSDVSITQASTEEANDVYRNLKVVHRGPQGWSVVRVSDKALMVEKLQTRDDAHKWASQYAMSEVGKAPVPAA